MCIYIERERQMCIAYMYMLYIYVIYIYTHIKGLGFNDRTQAQTRIPSTPACPSTPCLGSLLGWLETSLAQTIL